MARPGSFQLLQDDGPWQEAVYYALCAVYAVVGAVAMVQLTRIEMRVPEYGWTTQKVFHLMNSILNAARSVTFGFYGKLFILRPRIFEIVFLDLPDLLFFSTYTLLALFWAEIYYQAKSLTTDGLQSGYLFINSFIYVVQVCFGIYKWMSPSEVIFTVSRMFSAVTSFFAALGFLFYGGRLFLLLRKFPVESKSRQKKLKEVGSLVVICVTCFMARTAVAAWSAFYGTSENLDIFNHPIINLVYYLLAEVLPASLALFILRKLPPERLSGQYHPIR